MKTKICIGKKNVENKLGVLFTEQQVKDRIEVEREGNREEKQMAKLQLQEMDNSCCRKPKQRKQK